MCNLDYWILTLISHLYNLLNLLILYTRALMGICNKTKASGTYVTHLEFALSSLHSELFLKTGQVIQVYGWIIADQLETFDPDANYIDR